MKTTCQRRIMACLLILVLLCQLRVPALAYEISSQRLSKAQQVAEELYQMGLLQGSGTGANGVPDFALARTITRGEAITMLVRVTGGESEAHEQRYAHPFDDVPKWADPYVGYAFHYGISTGTGGSSFGTQDEIGIGQFMTMVLRALDHHDTDWRDPVPDAVAAGLDLPDDPGSVDRFCRADAILMCRSALDCVVLDEGRTLYDLLRERGELPVEGQSIIPGFVSGPVSRPVKYLTATDISQVPAKMREAVSGLSPKVTLHCPAGSEKAYSQAVGDSAASWSSGVSAVSVERVEGSGEIAVSFTHLTGLRVQAYLEGKTRQADSEVQELLEKLKAVMPTIVDPSMSQYQQVRAMHDYIVDHVNYRSGKRDQTAAGALLDGYSVCSGYTDALDLMCYLTGIECIQVTGTANSGTWGTHSWNKVKVDGQWYNVDCTWDDPVSPTPVLRHDYFLVSDSALSKDHKWESWDGLPACPASYPQ